jgi:hypothetical protein
MAIGFLQLAVITRRKTLRLLFLRYKLILRLCVKYNSIFA